MTTVPAAIVVRSTVEGNLHMFGQIWVEHDLGSANRRMTQVLVNPGHFWIRQDGSVTIRHSQGTKYGMQNLRIIAAVRLDGTVKTGVTLADPTVPTDPVLHFLNTDTEQRLIGSDYRDQHLRTCDIPQDKSHRIRLILAVMRGYRTPEGNRLRLREAANEVDRILGI